LAGENVDNEINAAKVTMDITKKKIGNLFRGGEKKES